MSLIRYDPATERAQIVDELVPETQGYRINPCLSTGNVLDKTDPGKLLHTLTITTVYAQDGLLFYVGDCQNSSSTVVSRAGVQLMLPDGTLSQYKFKFELPISFAHGMVCLWPVAVPEGTSIWKIYGRLYGPPGYAGGWNIPTPRSFIVLLGIDAGSFVRT